MNNIVVLIGGSSYGKSSILRSLCSIEKGRNFIRPPRILLINFNSKKTTIFIYSSSYQEIFGFCHYGEIIKQIKEDIEECEDRAKKRGITDFIIILAFTLKVDNGIYGYDCIEKPLEYLKNQKNYSTSIITVNRERNERDKKMNKYFETLKPIKPPLISKETSKGRQDDNARKLKKILKKL